mmetsp:Transcript_52899/g.172115  ORF Transcript_52899/g.172115 Transcript_52899/m.172115 type:complete len:508 (-) Transcript_52899:142-1665(-)
MALLKPTARRSLRRAQPSRKKRKSVAKLRSTTAAPRKSLATVKGGVTKVAATKLALVDPRTMGVDPKVLKEYEAAMRTVVKQGCIPGFASAVLRRGQVVHTMAHGHADIEAKQPFGVDTLCRLVCMTKSYVASAFMTLVDEGRADLEDRLDKYLPAFANVKVLPEGSTKGVKPKGPIRLRHIVSHTSGIGYPPDLGEAAEGVIMESYAKLQQSVKRGAIGSLRAFVERLAKVPLLCHPGETYEYGFSMDVLARVVEVIMGKDIEVCLQERVFGPLGMTSTMWAVDRSDLHRLAACYAGPGTWGNLYGHLKKEVPITSRKGMCRIDGADAEHSGWRKGRQCRVKSGGGFFGYTCGGLVSTVADTVRFVQMLMSKGMGPDGQRFLKEKTLEVMEQNRLKASWGKGMACYLGNVGVFRDGGKEFGMGGAACTYWSIDRADDTACIWFTQHIDMPEFGDLKGVNAKRADLWQATYDAIRTKAAKTSAKTRRPAASSGAASGRPPKKARSSK